MRERNWEKELRTAAARVSREMDGSIAYVNDRVVPAVRRGGFRALRQSARLLRRCADLLDGGVRS